MGIKDKEIVGGFQTVRHLLERDDIRIHEIWIQVRSQRREGILEKAHKRSIPVYFKEKEDFNHLLSGINHQGVAAVVDAFRYQSLQSILSLAVKKRGTALIVMADHITDAGNIGALLRVCAFFKVDGFIIPARRSASISGQVMKRSSGGYLSVPIAKVSNLKNTALRLKREGFWIIGTDERAKESIYDFDWRRDVALIVGSEERGINHSLVKICDELVSIPFKGDISSLNVSVALGIVLSEIHRQRRFN